jgi:large subunit ribosomal protein L30
MYAVVRVRGSINVRKEARQALEMLRLKSPNNAIVCPENREWKGMLQRTKDWVTFGEIDKKTLVELLQKRLRATGDRKVDEKILKEASGYDSFEKFAEDLQAGKIKLKNFARLKPFFRLTPPSKGFKSVKLHYPRGDLGYRGKAINELLERMM